MFIKLCNIHVKDQCTHVDISLQKLEENLYDLYKPPVFIKICVPYPILSDSVICSFLFLVSFFEGGGVRGRGSLLYFRCLAFLSGVLIRRGRLFEGGQ